MATLFDPFRESDRFAAGSPKRKMPIDLYRDGDRYVLSADLPGIDPSSVDVDVDGQLLTIRAERAPRASDGVRWLSRELSAGSFVRQLTLGEGVDRENIAATYDAGVLTVTIPVAEKAKPRKIEISVTGTVATEQVEHPVAA